MCSLFVDKMDITDQFLIGCDVNVLLAIGGDQSSVKESVHHPYNFLTVSGWSRSCSVGKFRLFWRETVVRHAEHLADDLKSA